MISGGRLLVVGMKVFEVLKIFKNCGLSGVKFIVLIWWFSSCMVVLNELLVIWLIVNGEL